MAKFSVALALSTASSSSPPKSDVEASQAPQHPAAAPSRRHIPTSTGGDNCPSGTTHWRALSRGDANGPIVNPKCISPTTRTRRSFPSAYLVLALGCANLTVTTGVIVDTILLSKPDGQQGSAAADVLLQRLGIDVIVGNLHVGGDLQNNIIVTVSSEGGVVDPQLRVHGTRNLLWGVMLVLFP
ncbi:hypothetical protein GMORB2_3394 [Geosmithia morbida]|uniref:Uncharacterized protein n=1 Tax=Geosmithia morbida TaxID=1094350 RepID=A0A9P4YQR4_9HYPO|nr:uncharacterized protein GMORB2_3394 [Geosmithia morbida]KAF4119983.1 hypothetical protein GMORB2_3394 [Geosmithia morbida]